MVIFMQFFPDHLIVWPFSSWKTGKTGEARRDLSSWATGLMLASLSTAGYYRRQTLVVNSRKAIAMASISLLLFFTIQRFQFGVVISVTPKQEMERKSDWFCGVKFCPFNFKLEWENGVWTKLRFLASGFFLFPCGNFTLFFFLFFRFLDRIFSKSCS